MEYTLIILIAALAVTAQAGYKENPYDDATVVSNATDIATLEGRVDGIAADLTECLDLAGTRPMTGALDMGGNSITNIGGLIFTDGATNTFLGYTDNPALVNGDFSSGTNNWTITGTNVWITSAINMREYINEDVPEYTDYVSQEVNLIEGHRYQIVYRMYDVEYLTWTVTPRLGQNYGTPQYTGHINALYTNIITAVNVATYPDFVMRIYYAGHEGSGLVTLGYGTYIDDIVITPLDEAENETLSRSKIALWDAVAADEALYPVFIIPMGAGYTDLELKGTTNNFAAEDHYWFDSLGTTFAPYTNYINSDIQGHLYYCDPTDGETRDWSLWPSNVTLSSIADGNFDMETVCVMPSRINRDGTTLDWIRMDNADLVWSYRRRTSVAGEVDSYTNSVWHPCWPIDWRTVRSAP